MELFRVNLKFSNVLSQKIERDFHVISIFSFFCIIVVVVVESSICIQFIPFNYVAKSCNDFSLVATNRSAQK